MILKFHSETPIVLGYNRSCIYDLPRQKYDFVPNEVINTLRDNINCNISDLNNRLDNNDKIWLKFLMENEYCFLVPDFFIDSFPEINFKWESPANITNAIIDLDNLECGRNFKYFEEINCKHILLRFVKNYSADEIVNFLFSTFNDLTFKSVEVVLPFNLKSNKKNNHIIFKKIIDNIEQVTSIKFFEEKIETDIFTPYLSVNIGIYTEALLKNVYFNGKIYIESKGNIKNGIETKEILGNFFKIKNSQHLIKKIKNSKLWGICKDQIDVCKDCEFRYMCIDNRVPQERNNGSFYYKSECSYNPYISKWKGELGYLSLNESGILLNDENCFVNYKKVNEINKSIWSDKV